MSNLKNSKIMENCLVTKLKSSVKNDNLVKYDTAVFEYPNGNMSNISISVVAGSSVHIIAYGATGNIVLEGDYYPDAWNNVNIQVPEGQTVYKVSVKSKNLIRAMSLTNLSCTYDFSKYGLLNNLTIISSRNYDAAYVIRTTLKDIAKACPNLTTVTELTWAYAISGDISDLGSLINLTTLNIIDTRSFKGSLNSLFDKMAANGKTSTLEVNLASNTTIAYNETIEASLHISVTFSNGTWTATPIENS